MLNGKHILPTPPQVAVEMWHDKSYYWPNMLVTLREAGKGYLAGNAVAILLAIVFVQVPIVERLLMRLAIASYCIPIVAIAPILIVTTSGDTPKAALAAIIVLFTTLIATLLGLRSVDKSTVDLVKSCGGGSWMTLRKVRLHAALPSIFAGLRIAAPSALLGAIIGEYLGANAGPRCRADPVADLLPGDRDLGSGRVHRRHRRGRLCPHLARGTRLAALGGQGLDRGRGHRGTP